MKIRRWLPSATLALCAALAISPLHAADAEWPTSWDAFVDAFNICIRDAACDRTEFVDKSVT